MPDLAKRRGDFDQWFARRFGWPVDSFQVIDAVGGQALPAPDTIDALIISGSAHTLTDYADWSVRATAWVELVLSHGTPTLGVCYGHQMIGEILGGQVGINPRGREVGVHLVDKRTDDPLFEGLPDRFPVIQTHRDAVLRVPDGANVIARSELCDIQALAIGDHVRTIQWHPEFDAEIIRYYIRARSSLIDGELGRGTSERILSHVREVDSGAIIVRNFMRHFLKRDS